jgi:hypothetical protein
VFPKPEEPRSTPPVAKTHATGEAARSTSPSRCKRPIPLCSPKPDRVSRARRATPRRRRSGTPVEQTAAGLDACGGPADHMAARARRPSSMAEARKPTCLVNGAGEHATKTVVHEEAPCYSCATSATAAGRGPRAMSPIETRCHDRQLRKLAR